jgi:hypothetical protein
MSRRLISNVLSRLGTSRSRAARPQPRRPARPRLGLEPLEDRTLLSVQFTPAPYTVPAIQSEQALGTISSFVPIEPALSVGADPGNVAVSSQAGMRVSTNDGGSFTAAVGFPGSRAGDTSSTYDSAGRLFWVNLTSPGGQNGISISQINPTTGAVIATHVVDQPPTGFSDDKEFIAADPTNNNLYVIWTCFDSSNNTHVLMRFSTDQGNMWSNFVQVDNGSDGFTWPATVTVAPDHHVYATFHSVTIDPTTFEVADHNGKVVVVRYNNDLTSPLRTLAENTGFADVTFNVQTANRTIPGMTFWTQGAAQPWVLADPVRPGNIYVVSADSNNGFTNDPMDVRIARSTDFGQTWTSSLVDASSNAARLFPNAAIDPFGDIVVTWYDNRRLLTNSAGHYKLDVFGKYSTDGGQTWSSAFQVSPTGNPFDPDPGAVNRYAGPPPTTRIGEYFGLGLFGGTAYVARNANTFSGITPVGQQVWFDEFAIRGALTVTGTAGNDTITIRNEAGNANFVEVLVNGQRQYAGLWSALTGITVNEANGNDTVNIENSAAGVPITVNQGSGTDTINVTPTSRFLDNIQGNLTLNGGLGVDTLNVFDQSDTFPDTYTLTAGSVTRTASALISYGGVHLINFVNINGGSGNATYNVNGTEAFFATTLDTGPGQDTVNVRATGGSGGTLAVNTTTGSGGGGNDVVNIGNAGSVQGIAGAVTILNNPSRTHVNIDDSADGGNRNVTISGSSVTGLAPATLTFTSLWVNTLSVRGGSGSNTYTVSGTPAFTSVTLDTGGGTDTTNVQATSVPLAVNTTTGSGGGGNDVVNLGNGGSVQGIVGAVTISNTVSRDHVNIDDSADGANRGATISSGGVTGLAPATINFTAAAVNTLTVLGGGGTDTYTVSGTPASASVTLTAGGGTNTLVGPNVVSTWQITGTNAGQLTGTGLVPITFTRVANLTAGSVSGVGDFVFGNGAGVTGAIDGGGGFGELDYGAYTTPVTVNLSTNTATGAGRVSHFRILRGGAGDDSLTGNANDVTIILASPGNDTVSGVSSAFSTFLDGINANNTWNITGHNAGTLTFAGNTTRFTGVDSLIGANVADHFFIADRGSVDTQINGAGGRSTLDYSAYRMPVTVRFVNNIFTSTPTGVGAAFSIENFIGGAATNTLIGLNANTTWNVTAQNTGNLNGAVNFSGFQNLTGGSAPNTFVLSNGVGVDGNINGGSSGNNQLNESAYTTAVTVDLTANTATGVGGGFANLQGFVGGSAGNNTLNGPAGTTSWSIIGSNAGSVTGGFSFSAFQNLTGGAGNNTFVMGAGTSLSGTVTGGGGTNSLDYSAFTGNVIVDLQTGFATAIGGGLAGTFVNVHGSNLSGSGLYNLLIGAGGNTLTGGTNRRNILVAGASASTLIGGTLDDLLIGGTTIYDNAGDNLASWLQIAGYWAGTDPFNTRVNNLLTGNGVPLLDATTVTGNGGGNTMTGSNELALLYSDGADTISGFDPSSPIEPISP